MSDAIRVVLNRVLAEHIDYATRHNWPVCLGDRDAAWCEVYRVAFPAYKDIEGKSLDATTAGAWASEIIAARRPH